MTINTQIRIPEDMKKYIEKKANETGVSQNAMMLMLISLGKKVLESNSINLHPD